MSTKLATVLAVPPDTPTGQRSTIAGARDALVQALNGVTGISATPAPPEVPATGCAWPRWVNSRATGHLEWPRVHTFDVYALLPAAATADTITQADALLEVLLPALAPVAVIDTAEPVLVQFGPDVTMPALVTRVTAR